MGFFHVFYIIQMVPNRATHHNYETYLSVTVFNNISLEKFLQIVIKESVRIYF